MNDDDTIDTGIFEKTLPRPNTHVNRHCCQRNTNECGPQCEGLHGKHSWESAQYPRGSKVFLDDSDISLWWKSDKVSASNVKVKQNESTYALKGNKTSMWWGAEKAYAGGYTPDIRNSFASKYLDFIPKYLRKRRAFFATCPSGQCNGRSNHSICGGSYSSAINMINASSDSSRQGSVCSICSKPIRKPNQKALKILQVKKSGSCPDLNNQKLDLCQNPRKCRKKKSGKTKREKNPTHGDFKIQGRSATVAPCECCYDFASDSETSPSITEMPPKCKKNKSIERKTACRDCCCNNNAGNEGNCGKFKSSKKYEIISFCCKDTGGLYAGKNRSLNSQSEIFCLDNNRHSRSPEGRKCDSTSERNKRSVSFDRLKANDRISQRNTSKCQTIYSTTIESCKKPQPLTYNQHESCTCRNAGSNDSTDYSRDNFCRENNCPHRRERRFEEDPCTDSSCLDQKFQQFAEESCIDSICPYRDGQQLREESCTESTCHNLDGQQLREESCIESTCPDWNNKLLREESFSGKTRRQNHQPKEKRISENCSYLDREGQQSGEKPFPDKSNTNRIKVQARERSNYSFQGNEECDQLSVIRKKQLSGEMNTNRENQKYKKSTFADPSGVNRHKQPSDSCTCPVFESPPYGENSSSDKSSSNYNRQQSRNGNGPRESNIPYRESPQYEENSYADRASASRPKQQPKEWNREKESSTPNRESRQYEENSFTDRANASRPKQHHIGWNAEEEKTPKIGERRVLEHRSTVYRKPPNCGTRPNTKGKSANCAYWDRELGKDDSEPMIEIRHEKPYKRMKATCRDLTDQDYDDAPFVDQTSSNHDLAVENGQEKSCKKCICNIKGKRSAIRARQRTSCINFDDHFNRPWQLDFLPRKRYDSCKNSKKLEPGDYSVYKIPQSNCKNIHNWREYVGKYPTSCCPCPVTIDLNIKGRSPLSYKDPPEFLMVEGTCYCTAWTH